MRAAIDDFMKRPGSWLSMRKSTGVVISSRVRLARNVADVAFPGWAGEDERIRLCERLSRVLSGLTSAPNHKCQADRFADGTPARAQRIEAGD